MTCDVMMDIVELVGRMATDEESDRVEVVLELVLVELVLGMVKPAFVINSWNTSTLLQLSWLQHICKGTELP